jgi:putative Mg2+ transporter-C (MgtC) family protein
VELIAEEFMASMPRARELVRALMRMMAALAVGALVGYQRERMGKAAGLRTHMLVSVGTALLVICAFQSGMDADGASRVIQGLVTGIGFLVAIGPGQIGIGLIAGVVAWVVLGFFHMVAPEQKAGPPHGNG